MLRVCTVRNFCKIIESKIEFTLFHGFTLSKFVQRSTSSKNGGDRHEKKNCSIFIFEDHFQTKKGKIIPTFN